MAEDTREDSGADRNGDRRGRDRRKRDRRRSDRRAPTPVWRQPWALVGYGVVGALAVVLIFGVLGDDSEPETPRLPDASPGTVPLAVREAPERPTGGPLEDATTVADYERLVAEGATAVGRPVRAQLFCDPISSVSLRDVDTVQAAVAPLVDSEQRVPAAQCKWGASDSDSPRGDLMLLVPAELAESFANAPVVQDAFVSRRRLLAEVEWLGRSDALSLRNTAVLRQLLSP